MLDETNKFFGSESPMLMTSGGFHYEPRPQQAAMANAVAEAMEGGYNLCVEAPTGIGKTFAYLVPAYYQSQETGKPVIISTHTINLQEQIISRDIPLLEKMLGVEINAVVAKGRSNYLCLRRFGNLVNVDQELMALDAVGVELKRLQQWAATTETGDRSEMTRGISSQLWNNVCSERGNCLGGKCDFFKRCFVQKARRAIFSADIIVMNHAKFFSSLALAQEANVSEQDAQLPDYSAVVLDEGHTLEETASNHLGMKAESFELKYMLGRLYSATSKTGILMQDSDADSRNLTLECRRISDSFFDSLTEWVLNQGVNPLRYSTPNHIQNYLDAPINKLLAALKKLIEKEDDETRKAEMTSVSEDLAEFNNVLETFFTMALPDDVYWFECSGDRGDMSLNIVPIDVAPVLSNLLFAKKPVIVTSATLAVNGSISYFQQRVGCPDAKSLVLDSPFDFPKQVSVHIASSLPDPNSELFSRQAVIYIERFLRMTDGRAFVLFTSYGMMRGIAKAMQNFFEEEKMTLLMQGEDLSPKKMLEEFRNSPRSVIFGTSSFWTGVDVPGDALQNVIITKLPFAVPDHPLTEARNQLVEQRGGRPFFEISVPEAVLKFRQGFGRLIRTKEDTGIVVILDSRIVTKNYGKQFLNSIPQCPINYV